MTKGRRDSLSRYLLTAPTDHTRQVLQSSTVAAVSPTSAISDAVSTVWRELHREGEWRNSI